jgi:hypothetical protein
MVLGLRMQNDKWKMSEDDRTLLNDERVRAERAYIAKILARKNLPDGILGAQAPADPKRDWAGERR